MSPEAQLAEGLVVLGNDLPASAQQRLLDYAGLLEKWNHTYRLTALSATSLAISHHLLDSLAVLPFVKGATLLDVGSGGGMPGIPLAIARPELQVTLLDSSSKKTAFMQQVAIELSLANIAVHCGRVETYRPPARFATITARAFSDLSTLVKLSGHLLQSRWPLVGDEGRLAAGRDRRPAAGSRGGYGTSPGRAGRQGRAPSGRDAQQCRAALKGESIWQEYSR
jgi:16S rRNA (guanine527-N7)-methyltransferase